jgi:fatty acid desaturase
VILNPFVQFLYWQMNYHIEHHMYAAIPCYNLGRLHREIKSDLPDCHKGLWAAWKDIIAILRRQQSEPAYQYAPDLPARVSG